MTTAFDKDLELIFQKLTSDRQVKQALDFLKQDAPNTIAQQKELVVIEAPTFQEKTTQPTLRSNAESCRSAGCDHR